MRFTAEEKQILALYFSGSVKNTFNKLGIAFEEVCENDKDPYLEDIIYSTMMKLIDIDERELRRAVRDTERPVGIWP